MENLTFEIGPIRPPSEASSLLLRVTRNCPWNRCLFCHIYKGKRFERRSVEEVKKDIEAARRIADEIKSLSWRLGYGGDVAREVLQYVFSSPSYDEHFRSVALWLYFGGKSVFFQDANSLVMKTSDLVEILRFLKEKFPQVERVTSYARSRTAAKGKSLEELKELREAGLSRLHIGLESGWDFLLEYMKKGVTAKEHVEGGRKVVEAGIELSEYVILGLGGKRWWKEHAIETAKVLNEINPHFIRIRTLMVLPQMPLYRKMEEGDFVLQSEEEMIVEERLLIEGLDGITSTFLSDHILNLLGELEGKFPEEKAKLLAIIDRFLSLPKEEKLNYCLGRRAGIYETMEDMKDPYLHNKVKALMEEIRQRDPDGVEKAIFRLKENFL
ncbi:MAG: radical SAM protein [Deltaproteobacteria bacterium]|nr:MAG: radical SAM protein [Deltaproteobacteria bacterium]